MMRTISFTGAILCVLTTPMFQWAQSTTTQYQTDINGRREPLASQDSAKGSSTQRMQSINGRQVPLEQVTERVVREDARGKVIERTIQKYDATGRPAGQDRITVEETNLGGGSKRVTETHASSELSGPFRTTERVTSETTVSDQRSTTSTTLERPGVNSNFQTAERRTIVVSGAKGQEQTTETVDRPDFNGRFRTVERSETNLQSSGGNSTESTATYQIDPNGRMALAKQVVAKTTKGPNGDVTETNVYGTSNVVTAQSGTDNLRLQEQRTTQRVIGADGSVRETVNLRVANASDRNQLGAPRQVSESVCTGKCLPAAPAPVAPAAAATPAPAATKGAPAASSTPAKGK